jgi:hypothetical protein
VAILIIPVLILATLPIYQLKELNGREQFYAAVCIALPGQILDALTTLFFTAVFPNMPFNTSNDFGALMLWGYAVVILTGLIPLSGDFARTSLILTVAATILFSAPYASSQRKREDKGISSERREKQENLKAYRKIAVYEGGVFGYNHSFSGRVERDFDQLIIRNEKTGKVILGIDYDSIIAAYVESARCRPHWVAVAEDAAPMNVASPLGYVIKAKYHYLFVQYRDPETLVSGTAAFRFERLEAAESLLEQLALDLGMVRKEPIYVRRNSTKSTPSPTFGKENASQP